MQKSKLECFEVEKQLNAIKIDIPTEKIWRLQTDDTLNSLSSAIPFDYCVSSLLHSTQKLSPPNPVFIFNLRIIFHRRVALDVVNIFFQSFIISLIFVQCRKDNYLMFIILLVNCSIALCIFQTARKLHESCLFSCEFVQLSRTWAAPLAD